MIVVIPRPLISTSPAAVIHDWYIWYKVVYKHKKDAHQLINLYDIATRQLTIGKSVDCKFILTITS